ncbi:MAG: hypothetical protein ABI758_00525 [Candidatus Woesebacteria bacterium]
MSSKIEVGYSCWGFLGNGIENTPDGGRSHRFTLIDGLIAQGASVRMLQKNRDLEEAGEDFSKSSLSFSDKFPDLDFVFLEYRWPIPGRNVGIEKTDKLYMPDLDRQTEILEYYVSQDVPILIWDKDQKLPVDAEILSQNRVTVFEPSLNPREGRRQLLFPMDARRTGQAVERINDYQTMTRSIKLIYIGNQYERDESFNKYYDRPSKLLTPPAQIYGKWDPNQFLNADFHGRIGFERVHGLYEQSLTTVLIAPERYYKSGQMTQRLFESLWGLCIPFVPKEYGDVTQMFPAELIVADDKDVLEGIDWILTRSGKKITDLLLELFSIAQIFSQERQIDSILHAFQELR